MRTFVVTILAAAALASAGFAQSGDVLGEIHQSVVPTSVGEPGVFTRVVTGRFTGGERHHAVVLEGGVPIFVQEPAVFQAFSDLEEAPLAIDFDVLRYGGNAEVMTRDVLVVARHAGIDLIGYRDDAWYTDVVNHSSAFQGCILVRVRDLDGDDLDDIVTVGSNKRTIRILRQQTDGTFDADASALVTLTRDIRDLAVLEFDGNGVREIAVDCTSGVRVYDQSGSLEASTVSLRADLDCMTVLLREDGKEEILWCTAKSATPTVMDQELYLIHHDGGTATTTFLFETDQGISKLANGFVNDDLLPDVVVSLRDERALLVLFAQDTGSRYDGDPDYTHSIPLLESGVTGTGTAQPVVADISNDGVYDVLLPIDATRRVVVLTGRPVTGSGGESLAGVSQPIVWVNFTHTVTCGEDRAVMIEGDPTDVLTIFPQAEFHDLSTHRTEGWQLETAVYQMMVSGGGMSTTAIDPNPTSHCFESLGSFPVDGNNLRIGFEHRSDFQSYFYYLRLVQLDENDEVIAARPALLGAATKVDAVSLYLLPSLLFAGWGLEGVNECTSLALGPQRIDGFSRIRKLPPPGGAQSQGEPECHTHPYEEE